MAQAKGEPVRNLQRYNSSEGSPSHYLLSEIIGSAGGYTRVDKTAKSTAKTTARKSHNAKFRDGRC